MNRHVLSILVDNQPGVLSRVTGLFSRRGYNIASLSVGVTENEEVSRITVVVFCDDADCEQITKQVEKLIDVIRVVELSQERGVFRELALSFIFKSFGFLKNYPFLMAIPTFKIPVETIASP